jgi:hypothetical protein
MRINFPFVVVTTTLLLIACGNVTAPGDAQPKQVTPEFSAYWFAGLAEISVYDLVQARYGALRKGSAVMVFVTEPFSKKDQVKLDNPEAAGQNRLDVMKMNMTRNFETGIYPYSLELSVFNAIDRQQYPHAVKAVFTCQEWCGQVFSQYNQKGNHYQVQSYSYFESEGDKSQKLDVTWMEDELWNLVRLEKDALPTGMIEVIPGETYTRLLHKERKAEAANAEWETGDSLDIYRLTYESGRILEMHIGKQFPHCIEGWAETYRDGFGDSATNLTTRATVRKRVQTDYWNRHAVADSTLRRELGL